MSECGYLSYHKYLVDYGLSAPPGCPPRMKQVPYFRDYNYTELVQFIVAFSVSVVVATWGHGLLTHLLFVLFLEFLLAVAWRFRAPYWTLGGRIGVLVFAALGYVVGRWAAMLPIILI